MIGDRVPIDVHGARALWFNRRGSMARAIDPLSARNRAESHARWRR